MCGELKLKRDTPSTTYNKKHEVTLFNSQSHKYQPSELNLSGNLQEVPPYLQDTQHFSSKMWNFDDI